MMSRHKYLRSLEVPVMTDAEIAAMLSGPAVAALRVELKMLAGNDFAHERRREIEAALRKLRTGEKEN